MTSSDLTPPELSHSLGDDLGHTFAQPDQSTIVLDQPTKRHDRGGAPLEVEGSAPFTSPRFPESGCRPNRRAGRSVEQDVILLGSSTAVPSGAVQAASASSSGWAQELTTPVSPVAPAPTTVA